MLVNKALLLKPGGAINIKEYADAGDTVIVQSQSLIKLFAKGIFYELLAYFKA